MKLVTRPALTSVCGVCILQRYGERTSPFVVARESGTRVIGYGRRVRAEKLPAELKVASYSWTSTALLHILIGGFVYFTGLH